jgi:hypothetical protein
VLGQSAGGAARIVAAVVDENLAWHGLPPRRNTGAF